MADGMGCKCSAHHESDCVCDGVDWTSSTEIALRHECDSRGLEIDRLKRERQHIYDLLARIHRDCGQYTAEHGVEKSCDDAESQIVTWLETINSADALIEQARIAEREACAAICDRMSSSYSNSGLYTAALRTNACSKDIRARSAT